MKIKLFTGCVIVGAILALGAYDVYALISGGVEATLSRVTLRTALNHPIVPFAAGILCGHLFWPQRLTKENK